MIIKNIKLVNFRNHSDFFLEFNKRTSVIVGENGCGKTSILEAIYEVLQGKSFKSIDKEILKKNEEYYRIELNYYNGDSIICCYDEITNKKTFHIYDKKFGRLPKQYKYPIILFEPRDLNLIEASPVKRREYFDKLFSQISEEYYNSLSKYNRALKQRNELLKKEFLDSSELFSWNIMLVKYGIEILQFRKKIIRMINEKITNTYRQIAKCDDDIFIELASDVIDNKDWFLRKLEDNLNKDRLLGYTSFGIHRDDFLFLFNKKMADGVASRGEVRSMILALKFVEAEIMVLELQKKPLILMDDVFSELDKTRQECLKKNFKNNQIVITSVN